MLFFTYAWMKKNYLQLIEGKGRGYIKNTEVSMTTVGSTAICIEAAKEEREGRHDVEAELKNFNRELFAMTQKFQQLHDLITK